MFIPVWAVITGVMGYLIGKSTGKDKTDTRTPEQIEKDRERHIQDTIDRGEHKTLDR